MTIHRFKHWEYWPVWVIYLPCFFQYLYYALRSKTALFFTAANPGLVNGGAFYVPKSDIYRLLPKEAIPLTLKIEPGVNLEVITHWLEQEKISFPILMKPDHGLRGLGLVVIKNTKELRECIAHLPSSYLVQEFIHYPKELGVFFVKNPLDGQLSITSIVEKEFMSIIGNGRDTLETLIKENKRYAFQLHSIRKNPEIPLDRVLEHGEIYDMDRIGNHSRGAVFHDGNSHDIPALEQLVSYLLRDMTGVHYGRLDVKYESAEELYNMKQFKVIELNGALSEPAHIYDPRYSIWNAWKELIRHFKLLFNISQYQIKQGFEPMKLKDGIRLLSIHFRTVKEFSKLS